MKNDIQMQLVQEKITASRAQTGEKPTVSSISMSFARHASVKHRVVIMLTGFVRAISHMQQNAISH